MQVVLLGTGGGPRPSAQRFPSAQAVVLGNRIIVIDCGNGVAARLVAAGLDPRDVSDVLVTHHHLDHMADLAVLPMISWVNGRTEPIRIAGPPPTVRAFDALVAGFAEDLDHRTASTGRPPFRPMVHVQDVARATTVHQDAQVSVRSARVNHPPFHHALAFRIDADEGSVVVSGDTTPCDGLLELARGADVLIHEVVHPSAIGAYEKDSNAATIGAHLRNNHTMVDQVGAIAEAAGVGTLVLSHLVPHTGVSDDEWLAGVGDVFRGEVLVGHDLQVVTLDRHAGTPRG